MGGEGHDGLAGPHPGHRRPPPHPWQGTSLSLSKEKEGKKERKNSKKLLKIIHVSADRAM